MSKEAGATAVVHPVLPDWSVAKADKMRELQLVGQCPYCKHSLERREVVQRHDVRTAMFGERTSPTVLLIFWGCTNDLCRLMFWQHPCVSEDDRRISSDDIEH